MDPKHNEKKVKLRKIGIALLVIGGIFSLVGFIDFFAAFGGMGMPTMFWCLFIGFPMLGFGGMLLKASYIRETAQYLKDESVPVKVKNEYLKKIIKVIYYVKTKAGISIDVHLQM
jgi:hypothetical protein